MFPAMRDEDDDTERIQRYTAAIILAESHEALRNLDHYIRARMKAGR